MCCAVRPACDYIPSIMCDYAPKTSTNKNTHEIYTTKKCIGHWHSFKTKNWFVCAAAARRNEFILNRSSRLLPPPPPQHSTTSGMWLPGMRVCVWTIDCKDFFFFFIFKLYRLLKKTYHILQLKLTFVVTIFFGWCREKIKVSHTHTHMLIARLGDKFD